MRWFVFLFILWISLSSCSRRAQIDHDAKVRTRMESLSDQFDDKGKWQYDLKNAPLAFQKNCASCHENSAPLFRLAKTDLPQFWRIANFGLPSQGMPELVDKIPYYEMVDVTGYAIEQK